MRFIIVYQQKRNRRPSGDVPTPGNQCFCGCDHRRHVMLEHRRCSSTGVRRKPHRKKACHMPASDAATERFDAGARTGWEAAMLEIEHQAEHWDTPDHGETGYLIASALRSAVEIARGGGLHCE